LLGLRVQIPPGAWTSASCEFCMLPGRGLCNGLEESWSPVEMWWHTVTHGRGSEGEAGEWSWQPVLFTLPRNMVYPPLLPLMCTPWLPAVNWTDTPANLNGLVRFAKRLNLVSACVPSYFKHSLLIVVCLIVISKPQQWRVLGPLGLLSH
jgi:hypothetical protein